MIRGGFHRGSGKESRLNEKQINPTDSRPASLPPGSVYYEKLANKYHLAKYAVVILLVLFVLITSIAGRSELKSENFKYFFKYFQLDPFSRSSYEGIRYIGNSDMKFATYKGDLFVLCDGNATLYSMAGRAILSDHTDGADSFDASGKYLAVYRRGTLSAKLYNSFSDVYTISAEYPITCVCTDDDGGFAVVSSEKAVRTAITVYNKAFAPVYIWRSTDKYAVCTALSSGGAKLAVLAMGTNGGIQYSQLVVKNVSNGESVCEQTYSGEQPLGLYFMKNGDVAAVTDKAIRTYNAKGEKKAEIRLAGELGCIEVRNDGMTVCVYGTGNAALISVFDRDMNKTGEYSVNAKITKVITEENVTYALSYDRLFECGVKVESNEITGGAMDMFVLADGDVMICYPSGTELYGTNGK